MENRKQKLPFLYTLIRCGDDNQDLLFKRIKSAKGYGPNVWGMHMDINDPTPENVLIFVHGSTPEKMSMDEINKVQTYFREQVEPVQSNED